MSSEHSSPDCRACTYDSRRKAVERVIVSMRERLDEPLTMNEMAKIAYLSPFHFNRVFHQITGIPPTQFLYALRLEAAKRLLLTTDLSVTDVCYEVGYNSLGTFTTRFTNLVGLSPCHLRHLSEQLPGTLLEALMDKADTASRNNGTASHIVSSGAFITGQIDNPEPQPRVIFVGLFPTRIPQSKPIAGTLLAQSGPYCIGPVPDGRYYVFAAAFPVSKDSLTYLLPDRKTMLVGASQSPIIVSHGKVNGYGQVALRPMLETDPPILIALPSLLAEAFPDESSEQKFEGRDN